MPKGRFGLFHTTENITAAYNESALNMENAAKIAWDVGPDGLEDGKPFLIYAVSILQIMCKVLCTPSFVCVISYSTDAFQQKLWSSLL